MAQAVTIFMTRNDAFLIRSAVELSLHNRFVLVARAYIRRSGHQFILYMPFACGAENSSERKAPKQGVVC